MEYESPLFLKIKERPEMNDCSCACDYMENLDILGTVVSQSFSSPPCCFEQYFVFVPTKCDQKADSVQ